MKFLVDRCTGRRLSLWLRAQGHDVVDAVEEGPDPGDAELLQRAAQEERILITIDSDFGHMVFAGQRAHHGLVRLPDVPSDRRIELMAQLLDRHAADLAAAAIITVRGGRIRITQPRPAAGTR